MNNQLNKNSTLSGHRVLDLTDKKGMLCARLLADMGADVIRIDKPGTETPDIYLNAGKRSITLSLEHKRGREIFRQLVKTADILVESYQPRFLQSLELDYQQLSKVNPRLIMASITDFGQNGPYRDYKSCDLVNSALGGQMYVCGEQDSPPLKPFGNQTYFTASLFAATGILLASWHRHSSDKGQYIDVSMQGCVAATLDHVLVRYFYEGVIASRQGSLHWNNAFRIFPCRDGYILLSLFINWETLVEWLDSEGMAEDLKDKKWLDRSEQLKHLDHIIAVLGKWTKSHTVDELVEQGQLMHFPWSKVNSIPDLLNNPQLNERGFFVEAEHTSGKKYTYPGAMCRLSRSPWKVSLHTPVAGEHNKDVFQGELGLSEKEIESLNKDGVI